MLKEELQRKIAEYEYMLNKTNMSYLSKEGLIREFVSLLKEIEGDINER